MTKRTKILAVTLCLICVIAAGYKYYSLRYEPQAIASTGGVAMECLIAEEPYYCQTDSRWSEHTLGNTSESLGAVGCTLCCVSMALDSYGVVIPPDELNKQLTQNGGFTDRGWLIWRSIESLTDNKFVIDIPRSPSFEAIDDALINKRPSIVKIRLHGIAVHWVLVVGKDQQEYLVKDPLYLEDKAIPLSDLSAHIYSMRIIRPR